MMNNQQAKFSKLFQMKYLELALVLLCALLLSIWAMKHTIALRNSLLGLGCFLALIYLYRERRRDLTSQLRQSMIPLMFMGCLFLWVMIHYFLFSQDQILQFKELKSIWLRSMEAALLGWVCGLLVAQRPWRLKFLAYGLIFAFLALYLQYMPKAWSAKSLFQPNPFEYIFYGKINGVLIGTLLLAGLGGHLIDVLSNRVAVHRKPIFFTLSCIVIAAIPLYSYVYIFDAKNGIGLAAILGLSWFAWFVFVIRSDYLHHIFGSLKFGKFATTLVIIVPLALIVAFGALQVKQNPSWKYFIEDIQESVNLEKYPQWKSPSTLGYPTLQSGRAITPNVFERVSWATAGLSVIPQSYVGSGILQYPLQRALATQFPDLDPQSLPGSTHSGWIELTLSFGLPAIICIWGALVANLLNAMRLNPSNKAVIVSLSIAIFFLYLVGELSNHHAVEILVFSIVFLIGLNHQSITQKNKVESIEVL